MTTHPEELPLYRWPNLSPVQRQYLVRDDRGRYGIAILDRRDEVLFVRPIGQREQVPAPSTLGLPGNAVLITSTAWHLKNGHYTGWWSDDNVPTYPATVPPEMIRQLVILDDLGWRMPDRVADQALAGSDEMGHWNYGATLGKIGGEPPVKGQKSEEMNVKQAEAYARNVGHPITDRAIRLACNRGDIPGSRKLGRDWLITYAGLNHYLDNRPKPGPKKHQ